MYMGAGDISGRWVRRGVDRPDSGCAGDIRFETPDNEHQIFYGSSFRGCHFYTLMVCAADADMIAKAEGVTSLDRLQHITITKDAELQWCMMRLASRPPEDARMAGLFEEASRRLVLRIVQLSGGGTPDWHADASMFDRQTLAQLVHYIDSHLKSEPCLTEMSLRVGLSPSHFAKKFRLSTGISLHRFVTRRRIRASFETLKDRSQPLAHVALELGFSSQSHFTRVFSELTGMTPAKYRKQVKPVVG